MEFEIFQEVTTLSHVSPRQSEPQGASNGDRVGDLELEHALEGLLGDETVLAHLDAAPEQVGQPHLHEGVRCQHSEEEEGSESGENFARFPQEQPKDQHEGAREEGDHGAEPNGRNEWPPRGTET